MSYWVVKKHQTGTHAITKYVGPFSTEQEAEKKASEVRMEELRRPTNPNSIADAYFAPPVIEVMSDDQLAMARAGGTYIY